MRLQARDERNGPFPSLPIWGGGNERMVRVAATEAGAPRPGSRVSRRATAPQGHGKGMRLLCLLLIAPLFTAGCTAWPRKGLVDFGTPAGAGADSTSKDKKSATKSEKREVGKAPVQESPRYDPSVQVTLLEAILTGLSNNTEFTVERYNPSIAATSIAEERAAFDSTFRAQATRVRSRSSTEGVSQSFEASTGVSRTDPLGTKVEMGVLTSWRESLPEEDISENTWKSLASMSVTQALLKGAGAPANLATLRQACLTTMVSQYQVQAKAESVAATIESKYWDYFMAEGQVDIYVRSLKHAKRLVKETQDRIALGERARTEIYFAEAEAATREQNVLNARSLLEKTRLSLLRLMNPPSADLWSRSIKPLTDPKTVNDRLENPRDHIQLALRMRPDLNQARLDVEKGNLEVVKTRNGLLPKLDLFMTLGRAGFGRVFTETPRDFLWGTSKKEAQVGATIDAATTPKDSVHGSGGLDFIAGARTEFPPLNRGATAQYHRSVLTLAQQKEALSNLGQAIEEEILSAHVEVERAREQMTLTKKTVGFQRQKVEAEEEKYRLGKSAMFQVAQAERDLVLSELSELQARIDLVKGLTQFYAAEGSLLLRRGIALPSGRP